MMLERRSLMLDFYAWNQVNKVVLFLAKFFHDFT